MRTWSAGVGGMRRTCLRARLSLVGHHRRRGRVRPGDARSELLSRGDHPRDDANRLVERGAELREERDDEREHQSDCRIPRPEGLLHVRQRAAVEVTPGRDGETELPELVDVLGEDRRDDHQPGRDDDAPAERIRQPVVVHAADQKLGEQDGEQQFAEATWASHVRTS